MKQHKFKIIGALVILIIAVILGVTLTGGTSPAPPNPPGPTPVPPTPTPVPIDTGFNPYYLYYNTPMEKSKNKVSGILNFNQTVIDQGAKLGSGLEGLLPNISLSPGSVPTGPANAYMKNASFEFS